MISVILGHEIFFPKNTYFNLLDYSFNYQNEVKDIYSHKSWSIATLYGSIISNHFREENKSKQIILLIFLYSKPPIFLVEHVIR